jgi:hypothetical protein
VGAGEEPQHHHNTEPEQGGVRTAEWELHHHFKMATPKHGDSMCRGGLQEPLPTDWEGFVRPAIHRSTTIEDAWIHILGNAVMGAGGGLDKPPCRFPTLISSVPRRSSAALDASLGYG